MPDPYYADELVTLYHGDCREITEWAAADVLVTDPPYGIGFSQPFIKGYGTRPSDGIQGDRDTSVRDQVLDLFGADRPIIVFGSPRAPKPKGTRFTLIWHKPNDTGLYGGFAGWRATYEHIYLLGPWPTRGASRSSVLASNTTTHAAYTKRDGHPHAKPIDLMEQLISTCPPGTIADPFAGSGATLIAARNQGRRAIGVEVEERYCEIAARRLTQGVFTVPVETAPAPEYEQAALEGGAP